MGTAGWLISHVRISLPEQSPAYRHLNLHFLQDTEQGQGGARPPSKPKAILLLWLRHHFVELSLIGQNLPAMLKGPETP